MAVQIKVATMCGKWSFFSCWIWSLVMDFPSFRAGIHLMIYNSSTLLTKNKKLKKYTFFCGIPTATYRSKTEKQQEFYKRLPQNNCIIWINSHYALTIYQNSYIAPSLKLYFPTTSLSNFNHVNNITSDAHSKKSKEFKCRSLI